MNKSIRAMILSLTLAASVLAVSPGVAGFDSFAAYERGDYATAFEEYSIAAEQGFADA